MNENYLGGMNPKRFKEHRKDGWPLCPRCGEDELFSAICGVIKPDMRQPTLEECLSNGFACMNCDWTDD
jgi:hypothetical protein